jgi:DNA-binding MarR family transcriptional regulator
VCMANTGWLTDDQQQAWRVYRRMVLLVDAEIARELTRDCGLSMPDYQVLAALSEAADHQQRLSELALNMQWSASRLSHHVSRMEQRGLVTRAGCDSDARGAYVVLSEPGFEAIKNAAPDHVASVRRNLINLLTPQQIAALTDIGESVIGHFGEKCPSFAAKAGGQPDDGQSAKRSPESRSYAST